MLFLIKVPGGGSGHGQQAASGAPDIRHECCKVADFSKIRGKLFQLKIFK